MTEPFKSFEEMAEYLANGGEIVEGRVNKRAYSLAQLLRYVLFAYSEWAPYVPGPRTWHGLEGVQAMLDNRNMKLKSDSDCTFMVSATGELLVECEVGWHPYIGSIAVLSKTVWTEVL